MNVDEMAEELRSMCAKGEHTEEISTMVHLFGVKYARELKGMTIKDLKILAKKAGRPSSMGSEIHKGRKLSKYVCVKQGVV
ncbi:MAG: hypothetical protein OXI52_10320 [Caldilineaceae bacterium]|nr:hypothetical protein [Caldilineaceae bacterium]